MTEQEKSSVLMEKIVSIEDVGTINTYDFTIPNTHCFFANGVLVHNTGFLEEHSDIVLLLDWISKHSEIADESLYVVNVAKNRNGRTGFIKLCFEPEYYLFKEHDDNAYDKTISEINNGEYPGGSNGQNDRKDYGKTKCSFA